MIQFKIDTNQVRQWIENQPVRDKAKVELLNIIGDKIKSEVVKESKSVATTNALTNSVSYKVVNREKTEVSAINYASIAMETGRGAGKVPIDPLKRWARLKLGNENLAYPIAKKIAIMGTKRFRDKRPKQLTDVTERVTSLLTNDFDKLLNEYIK